MSRDQLVFRQLFENHRYGPRNGFEPRPWQFECWDDYDASVTGHEGGHEGNGGAPAGPHLFTVYGGTGSGKTKMAGLLASYHLNRKSVDQVVIVCPSRNITRKTRKELARYFGVELEPFHKTVHRNGVGRTKQGYILTYQKLVQDPTFHRGLAARSETLVIFDEVHHLGDDSSWGESSLEAFGLASFVVSLTGTPYRSDNRRIPFVYYEEDESDGLLRFKASAPYGFTYTLGRAVADGVCRKPIFIFHRGTVRIRTNPYGGELTVSFDDTQVSEAIASMRLRGAKEPGSVTRREMLAHAVETCRQQGRKLIIFLGGDTEGERTPTEDARKYMPDELQEMGIDASEYDVVTGDDSEAQKKMDEFGASPKRILIAINMVSEGVDIPELSAALFLTSVTAKQTTIQRIGRVLRRMGEDDPHPTALIFMFADANLIALSHEIEDEIRQEIDIRARRQGPSEGGGGNGPDPNRRRAEAFGIAGGDPVMITAHGRDFPIDQVRAEQARLRRSGFTDTYEMATLRLLFKDLDHVV